MIPGFTDHPSGPLAYSIGGEGPPLLLLHGFPQTRAMWAHIAPVLAQTHTVICPDLPGYGASNKPQDLAAYSFRAMAHEMLALMDSLGHATFDVVGHDRGARVAHRLTLDAPDRVTTLTLMDIIPTHTLLSDLRWPVANSYYHWFFLAQPAPFPDRMIAADPDRYFQSCLLGWGGAQLDAFDADQLAHYRAAWRDPETIRGMCNDYRATLAHDIADDAADYEAQIPCPTLVLFGASGAMAEHYDVAATWAAKCRHMQAQAIPGGHFFPDTNASDTIAALRRFRADARA
ncbi:Haloacetate dehalogenase H-1 [Roseovarius tolerans]|uniref:Haloacetate dehalogenase H-1 n=1 Tax=Roseovarius tolerans TaxID=74031 RepID=A0A0L6CVI8_9RHOB|nr:alpha/beta hydrolase [Roseovarius tolerans]KNX41789.1 Haloacetate dehalogenase H-1 [Roseovarius tolerans]